MRGLLAVINGLTLLQFSLEEEEKEAFSFVRNVIYRREKGAKIGLIRYEDLRLAWSLLMKGGTVVLSGPFMLGLLLAKGNGWRGFLVPARSGI